MQSFSRQRLRDNFYSYILLQFLFFLLFYFLFPIFITHSLISLSPDKDKEITTDFTRPPPLMASLFPITNKTILPPSISPSPSSQHEETSPFFFPPLTLLNSLLSFFFFVLNSLLLLLLFCRT